MSEENIAVVRRIFDGWASGDFGAGVSDLDPHVTFVVSPAFPEFGVTVGPEGIREYMHRFLEQWEHMTIEAKHLEAVGDTVLAHVIQHSKGRVSGIQGDLPYFMLFSFRAGKIIRMESVLDEADARQAAGLGEQAMSQENVEIVRRCMEAYRTGDYEASLAAFDPEVEFDVSIRPEGRVYRGPEGVAEAMRTWSGTWEDWKFEVEEIIDAGDRVVLVDRQSGRGKGSGIPLDQQTFTVFTLRDGKIVRAVWLATREEALEAAGLGE